ncbi:DUF317 domain-containing protein [Streptomyces diastatochromogenes]|uniref:DUF317 domain-containing protein n=1 Tax=Streptomyces diastatochromogenes TaxID=42236 RepID=A0A233RQC5_STRDA|nr:DUF317 domain-containing protein [Streptomyces diastatochromogenes]MCZ0990333.1 DUF317 domain-containing protein [Streptomyces diastatochromogenes]OXY85597.1 hypothetical protein BEK98_45525 [Streptomyces diastatochromogenes]
MPHAPETVDVDYISPRHLAGGGDSAWITVPLHRACGWSHGHDPLMPRVILSSPDQKALLRLEPDPDGQWWTLHHAPGPDRPAWHASFGARTPVEIIAAFTDALTDPTTDPSDTRDPLEPLRSAGWSPTYAHNRLASPDGTVRVDLHEETGTWWVTTFLSDSRPPVWQARFGEHTPTHLIAAFTTALTEPHPVARTGTVLSLPTHSPDLVTHTRQEVPAAQVAFVLEDRIRALAARHATPRTPLGVPQRPPSGPGRTR